ncbi:MAG: hypothetical protein ACO3N7_04385 [Kiritimatiellia bacterium]
MISVIVYGRNDSYGYNLHKRAAISFNCIAEMLNHPDDEIIFVDYNTPDDFPTFPEAIQDILTPRAKSRLRIFRVRPSFHRRYLGRTGLSVLEPIARNIGCRRSNPSNKWLLNTNTDIIPVPQACLNLSEYARNLAPGIYHAPRLELPETLWEFLDRTQPAEIIRQVREWGRELHLDERVFGSDLIRYDAPGDFQLTDRSSFFDIDGFDEQMLLGWHVDSNIAARYKLLLGEIGDAGTAFFAYHCDHTRQMTPIHRHDRVMNCHHRFVGSVTEPCLPEQRQSWGAPEEQIEEIRLDGSAQTRFVETLRSALGEPLYRPYTAFYSSEGFDKYTCDERHVLPYLTDLFFATPRNLTLAWFGENNGLLHRFAQVWQELGFTHEILFDQASPTLHPVPGTRPVSFEELLQVPSVYIFDYTPDTCRVRTDIPNPAITGFLAAVREEGARRASMEAPLKRFIGINAINNRFEPLFQSFVSAGATPFSPRMRHGFVLPPPQGEEDWLRHVTVGPSGVRVDAGLENRPGETGFICYGPYRILLPGRYRLSVRVDPAEEGYGDAYAIVELMAGDACLMIWRARGLLSEEFQIPESLLQGMPAALEVRVKSARGHVLQLKRLGVEKLSHEVSAAQSDFLSMVGNFLDLMPLGPQACWRGSAVFSDKGSEGFVCFGPYWKLPPADYEATFSLRFASGSPEARVRLEVIEHNRTLLAVRELTGDENNGERKETLHFSLLEEHGNLECRVWTNGRTPVEVLDLQLKRQ